MADDNKIEFEVVLNDGSTQKVFIKLERDAAKTADNIEKTFEKKNPVDGLPEQASSSFGDILKIANSTWGRIAIGATAAFAVVKHKLDEALEGEKLIRIEKQFESLATQAGVSADKIRKDFSAALGGVVDDSDAFNVLNQALAKTDVSAAKLPELMILARKATNLFGGDAIQNFNDITSAIASTNTRQLKQLGIIVDSEKAQKEYAKSIGTTSEYLSLEGKQTAILNEVLKIGGDRFKNVAAETGGATEAFARFNASMKNLGDAFSKNVAEAFGPKFAQVFEFFSLQIDKAGVAISGTSADASTKAGLVKREITQLENTLKSLQEQVNFARNNPLNFDAQFEAAQAATKIGLLKKEIQGLNSELKNLSDIQAEEAKKRGSDEGTKAALDAVKKRALDTIRFNEDKARSDIEYANQFRSIALQNIQTAMAETDLIALEEDRKKQIKGLKLAELAIQELTALDQLEQSMDQKRKSGLVSEEQYQLMRTAIIEQYSGKRRVVEEDEAIKRAKIVEDSNKQIQSLLSNGLINVVSAGMQRLGAALVKGPQAFSDFGSAILGILGDMLVSMGQVMITTSVAWKTFVDGIKFFLPESGIIAGLALIAIGGLLKSAAGAVLNPSASGGGVSGGSTSVSADTSAVAANTPIQGSGQQVAVNIHGNVFDTKETGLRIVDILNQSFQNDGTTLVTGAV